MKVRVGSFDPEVNGESASLEANAGKKRSANVNEYGEMLFRVKLNLDASMLYICPLADRRSKKVCTPRG